MREGMSVCKDRVMDIPSRVMIRGYLNESLPFAVVSVVSLGKSIHHVMSSYPLRMINSLESSSLNRNESLPR